MEKVNLYTRNGDFVAVVEVPTFEPPTDVVVWGERFFILRDEKYFEGLAYYVPVPLRKDKL